MENRVALVTVSCFEEECYIDLYEFSHIETLIEQIVEDLVNFAFNSIPAWMVTQELKDFLIDSFYSSFDDLWYDDFEKAGSTVYLTTAFNLELAIEL